MKEKLLHSGAVGYCQMQGENRGVLIIWDGQKVIDVNCEHKTCGHSEYCKLYQSCVNR